MKSVAPITVLLLVGFSSFYFLPPNVSSNPQAPAASSTTTTANEVLQPMTTNKRFDTFGSCFQNQCSQPIRYLFKPNGFVAWHNVGSGNITLTSFTVGGQSRAVSAFSNSTTIDYRISVPNIVTMDIYFKETPTNGRPSNTFKVTMIGTSSVSGTFTWNFGNPNSFPVTCDNTKKILTYGVTGINFTDSVNFNATCTNTTLSFTIGVGAFRIDPATIGTSTATSNRATQNQAQHKAYWSSSLSLFFSFYSATDNTMDCRSSTNGATWTASAALQSSAGAAGRWDIALSGSTVYYVLGKSSGADTNFYWRYGTISSGCSVSWTIAETTVAITGNTISRANAWIDLSTNLWVAFNTVQSAVNHIELWKCAGATSSCTWTKSTDTITKVISTSQPSISSSSTFIVLFYGPDTNNGVSLTYSTNSGSSWSSSFQKQSICVGQFANGIAMGAKLHMTCGDTSGLNIVYFSFDTSSNTFSSTTTTSSTGYSYIAKFGGFLIIVYLASATTVNFITSANNGTSWTGAVTVSTGETSAISLNAYTIITNNILGVEWTNGAGSPFNVRFQVLTLNAPNIIQSTSCTFTGSSGTCAFASNTKASSSIIVFAGATATTTVTSVTDTQVLTYMLIVASDVGTVGDDEAWWACHPSTAAADTITVTYGVSVTSTIILYELHGRPTGTGCAPSSSTGSSASASSAAVTSYTPTANAFIIGALNSNCQVACTITAGSGYSLDKNVAINAVNDFTTEFFWNVATADTTPYTFSLASAYNEISVAFYDLTWKNETFARTMTLSPAFAPQLTLSKAFGASATFVPKFNQALNLHSFLPAFTLSPFFNWFHGLTPPGSIASPIQPRDQLPGFLGLTAMAMLMMFFVFIIRRRRR